MRRRRRGKIAEKLPDVVVDEQMGELPSYEESQSTEAKNLMAELKSNMEADKQTVKDMLNKASQVKQEED